MDATAGDTNRKPRIRWGAVLASVLLTPVAGYVAVGRWRRAVLLIVAELIYLTLGGIAGLTLVPWLMSVAMFLGVGHGLGAIVDVARLSRTSDHPSSLGWTLAAGVAALVFFQVASRTLRAFVIEAFQSPAGSMLPTLEVGDHFFVGKPFRSVRRGDVIVFQFPLDPSVQYVKRAVALGGDSIEIAAGQLVVNGQPVPTRSLGVETHSAPPRGPYQAERWRETLDGRSYDTYRNVGSTSTWSGLKVPANHVFVIGDNRDNSNDSRVWGTVPLELVTGRALFVWWSSSAAGIRWDRMSKPIE